MESWQIVLLVLGGIFVGAFIPVLLQLRATLRQLERRLRTTGKRVDRTLDEARAAAERVNKLIGGLDGGEKQLANLLTSMGQLAQTVDKVRSTVNIASAVGAAIAPAVVAMVRSFGEEKEVRSVERREGFGTNGNGMMEDDDHGWEHGQE